MYRNVLLFLTIVIVSACSPSTPEPTATPEPTFTPEPTEAPTEEAFVPAGTDIHVALPPGDAERGAQLVRQQGCMTCHGSGSLIGPPWEPADGSPALGARAETRYQQEDYGGEATTAEEYLFESIVSPSAYIVEGFSDNVMLPNLADFLSLQDVADIVAYLQTLR